MDGLNLMDVGLHYAAATTDTSTRYDSALVPVGVTGDRVPSHF
jgi:hypothetical protein